MGGSIGFGDPFFWPKSCGFVYYDDANKAFDCDNAGMVESYETIKRFYDLVGAEKMSAFRQSYGTWTGPSASFCVATQAVQNNGYWTPGEMKTISPDLNIAYSWVPVPAARKGTKVQSMGGHYIFLPVGSPNPEDAFKFGEYMMTDAACDIIYNGLGWLPSRKSYLEKADLSKYPGLDWFVQLHQGGHRAQRGDHGPDHSDHLQHLHQELRRRHLRRQDAAAGCCRPADHPDSTSCKAMLEQG